MDPELSIIMANQAKVDEGHFVYDPFVGSGKFHHSSLSVTSISFLTT